VKLSRGGPKIEKLRIRAVKVGWKRPMAERTNGEGKRGKKDRLRVRSITVKKSSVGFRKGTKKGQRRGGELRPYWLILGPWKSLYLTKGITYHMGIVNLQQQ